LWFLEAARDGDRGGGQRRAGSSTSPHPFPLIPSSHFPNLPPMTYTPTLAVAGFLQILVDPGLPSATRYASFVVGASPSSRWRATTCTRPQVQPAASTTSVCALRLSCLISSLSLYLSSWQWIGTALICMCLLTRPCSAAACVRPLVENRAFVWSCKRL
jgi:hypothetical protein